MLNKTIVAAFAGMLLMITSAFGQTTAAEFAGSWNGVTQQGTKVLLVVSPQGGFEVSSTRGSDKVTLKITGNTAEFPYANGAAKFVLQRKGDVLQGESIVGSRGGTAITFSK